MSTDSPIINKELRHYLDSLGFNESDILKENREETKKLGAISIMQTGAAQGSLLSIICKLSNFNHCLEIGTFTGYSSICIASSISNDSKLTVVDNNQDYINIAEKFWKRANLLEKIEIIKKDGMDALRDFKKEDRKFDFVYIDADKSNYINYYELSISMVKSGGLICLDNTLWKGRVYGNEIKDKSTKIIQDLNSNLKNDKRIIHSLLTIYDGMTLCYVK